MRNAYRVADVRAAEDQVLAMGVDLMQRAATGLAGVCLDLLRDMRGAVYGAHVVILVGAGNNGGDALWAGVTLARRGARVEAVCTAQTPHAGGLVAFRRAGGRLVDAVDPAADLVVDGLVGIGAQGALREPAASHAASLINHRGTVVAVDVPSGVDPDTGSVVGVAVEADVTVTFGCMKPGLLVMPALQYVGALIVIDIGLPMQDYRPAARVMESADVASVITQPQFDAYKYNRGVVGVAAGSAPYPGAAQLCVDAARLIGVGMVEYLDRDDGVADRVHAHFPDVVVTNRVDDPRIRSWGAGSGFVGDDTDRDTMSALLEAQVPVVIDAGGLTALANDPDLRSRLRQRRDRGLHTVLTPHEGEFRRLRGAVEATDRLSETEGLARELGCIVVRKGPGTVIADGVRPPFVDSVGTSALATAGSGDVLTGLCAGLLATSDADLEHVAAAVYIHGLAGHCAEPPVTAPALIRAIPDALEILREAS